MEKDGVIWMTMSLKYDRRDQNNKWKATLDNKEIEIIRLHGRL